MGPPGAHQKGRARPQVRLSQGPQSWLGPIGLIGGKGEAELPLCPLVIPLPSSAPPLSVHTLGLLVVQGWPKSPGWPACVGHQG